MKFRDSLASGTNLRPAVRREQRLRLCKPPHRQDRREPVPHIDALRRDHVARRPLQRDPQPQLHPRGRRAVHSLFVGVRWDGNCR